MKGRKKIVRDLSFMDDDRRDHYVYRVYDDADRLLYVGCSQDLKKRWQEHRGSSLSPWTDFAARFKVAGPYPYRAARLLEGRTIEAEQPWFNETLARRTERQRGNRRNYLAEYLTVRAEFAARFAEAVLSA